MITRDVCINDPALVAVLVAANLVIFAAYVAIPSIMGWIALRARIIPFPAIWCLFGGFILSCAGTHACAVLVFFRAAWNLEAAACCFTAIISSATAAVLWRWRQQLLAALNDFYTFSELMKAQKPVAALG